MKYFLLKLNPPRPKFPQDMTEEERDLGFVFGAIGIGFLADLFGLNIAIHLVAFLAIGSAIFVLTVMKETIKQR
jgi:hypothetical protein